MKPALTAEEWAAADRSHVGANWPRHGTAALALYGQPFGFTREDVAALRYAASSMDGEWGRKAAPSVLALNSLADRIEALLPLSKPSKIG